MQQASADRRHRALLAYYDDAAAERVAPLSDAALVAATRRELSPLASLGLDLSRANATVERWERSGTVLDDRRVALYRPEHARATARIFLAGDYIASTPGWGYGLDDAVASGKSTAALVSSLWAAELPEKRLARLPWKRRVQLPIREAVTERVRCEHAFDQHCRPVAPAKRSEIPRSEYVSPSSCRCSA